MIKHTIMDPLNNGPLGFRGTPWWPIKGKEWYLNIEPSKLPLLRALQLGDYIQTPVNRILLEVGPDGAND